MKTLLIIALTVLASTAEARTDLNWTDTQCMVDCQTQGGMYGYCKRQCSY